MPFFERYLFVCTNRRPDGHAKGSCAQRGSEEVLKRLKLSVARHELGRSSIRVCASGCLDLCEAGSSVLQEPEHVAYGRVGPDDAEALAEAAARGEVLERLVTSGR